MSLKELTEFDPHLGQNFRKVDFGKGLDLEEEEKSANRALLYTVVGLRKHWKIAVVYFFINGASGGLLAGLVREFLERCYNIGVRIWTATMDNAGHNITAFRLWLLKVLQSLNIGSMRRR